MKRISRDKETSAALESQHARLDAACAERGYTIAGWVEDATVSGAVNLDKRRSLGKWMREPLVHDWDIMMVTEQDRITRDDLHWASFVGWALEHNKAVIVLDDPSLDLTTPNGRMIANIKAVQATNYRNDIQKKRRNQLEYFRDELLWPGGPWPFGYRAIPFEHNGTPRWKLEIDPITGPLVLEAYDRLVNKTDSQVRIAKDWNSRGILTALDHQRSVNAVANRPGTSTKVRGTKWSAQSLRTVLSKESLKGVAVHKGRVLLRDGLPVQWAEPLLSRAEFETLQEVIRMRGDRNRGVPRTAESTIGIFYCMCGAVCHRSSAANNRRGPNGKHRYYNCRTLRDIATPKCAYAMSWRQEFVHDSFEEMFLGVAADLEIVEKTFVPGEDRSGEILELREALDNLAGNLTALKPGSAGAQAILRTIEQHENSLAALEAIPIVASRWEEHGTGQTFAQFWEQHDWSARADLLRRAGVRMYLGGTLKAPDFDLVLPEDLQTRITAAVSGMVEPGYLDSAGRLADASMAARRDLERQLRGQARPDLF